MNITKTVVLTLLISLLSCSHDNQKDDECECVIEENVDKKTEKGQDNSDQTLEGGANGGVEALVKKAVDAKISISGSYLGSNQKIEEVYREIIGSNPQITQKANLYRSVACAYYEIACQDKTLSDKEKTDRLNEVVAGYEENIHKIINEEKTAGIEKEQLTPEPQKENINANNVRGKQRKKQDEIETKKTSSTQIEKIENSGNLSIGQTGGSVTQTTIVNPKEKFSEEEKREIVRNINLKYRAVGQNGATCVEITPNQVHPKSYDLCEDLENFLRQEGYYIIENTSTMNVSGYEKVKYRVGERSCMNLIITYVQ
ncbi:MAG: hypothetical protein SFV55_08900 [Haliscomenobacter sp.]|uniref:hypothetical protein n=1 Tax=Haliscomenobacter sp. TaxID=2717303 RepID=UPI0029B619FC|nr:hypothetical protein [Haliscomenobacter sp.]MDX2068530.1 hypothetical protein [Haliscomenobacter sp.]